MKFAAPFDRNIVHSKMLMTANSSSLAKTEERLMQSTDRSVAATQQASS